MICVERLEVSMGRSVMYEGRCSAPDGNGEGGLAAKSAGCKYCVCSLRIGAEGKGARIAQDVAD